MVFENGDSLLLTKKKKTLDSFFFLSNNKTFFCKIVMIKLPKLFAKQNCKYKCFENKSFFFRLDLKKKIKTKKK